MKKFEYELRVEPHKITFIATGSKKSICRIYDNIYRIINEIKKIEETNNKKRNEAA